MSKHTVSADGGPLKATRPAAICPGSRAELYLDWFSMCHRRLQALHRIAEGRQQPDDPMWITGVVSLLARHGWTPKDFGFVDPPTLDIQPNTGVLWAARAKTVN
jgi:hypothetical protein